MFYKQQKYNLQREESAGYAKLLAELYKDHGGSGTSPAALLRRIQSLIGFFELDPNRVLDMVLDAFEATCDVDTFVPMLQAYTTGPRAIVNLLGHKFQAYQVCFPILSAEHTDSFRNKNTPTYPPLQITVSGQRHTHAAVALPPGGAAAQQGHR